MNIADPPQCNSLLSIQIALSLLVDYRTGNRHYCKGKKTLGIIIIIIKLIYIFSNTFSIILTFSFNRVVRVADILSKAI